MTTGVMICPLCGFYGHDEYAFNYHWEQYHEENSPFVIEEKPSTPAPSTPVRTADNVATDEDTESNEDGSSGAASEWVLCPEKECGEEVLLTELNEHLDLHEMEKLALEGSSKHPSSSTSKMYSSYLTSDAEQHSFIQQHFSTEIPNALRQKVSSRNERFGLARSVLSVVSPGSTHRGKAERAKPKAKAPVWKGPRSARLGRRELGPYAYEEKMPRWLYKQLEREPKATMVNRLSQDGRIIKVEVIENQTEGIIPILAQLSATDKNVYEAYFCHPCVVHVCKTPKEGGFCGYRNTQMMVSYIQGARAQGHEKFPGRTPGILKLQDIIEEAWDQGINEVGRVQTGGIRGTRKYIGTPEAQAVFLSLDIDTSVDIFSDDPNSGAYAHESLLPFVEGYFKQAATDVDSKIHKTLLPPIYFQQPGHSTTIVGFERRKDGACNLLVFDPMYQTSPAMHRLLGRRDIKHARPEVIEAYRRGDRQLRKHRDFEILTLSAAPPLFPAWDVLAQFPTVDFVYAFFTLPTYAYEVIPEDYFIPTFPWHFYGGLFVTSTARFASCPRPASSRLGECCGLLGVPSLADREFANWLTDGTHGKRFGYDRRVLGGEGERWAERHLFDGGGIDDEWRARWRRIAEWRARQQRIKAYLDGLPNGEAEAARRLFRSTDDDSSDKYSGPWSPNSGTLWSGSSDSRSVDSPTRWCARTLHARLMEGAWREIERAQGMGDASVQARRRAVHRVIKVWDGEREARERLFG